jgi:hypothetical protein
MKITWFGHSAFRLDFADKVAQATGASCLVSTLGHDLFSLSSIFDGEREHHFGCGPRLGEFF